MVTLVSMVISGCYSYPPMLLSVCNMASLSKLEALV
uniref:Uncharacterized protein n=1 Tax=Rhizophora mucronata TaxID=61149 RepID=A0A2P2PWS5_RHIMU